MAITIPLGQVWVFTLAASGLGTPNPSEPATVGASNPAILRATMDPGNNRRFAVTALALGTTNVNVSCGGITQHMLTTVGAAQVPPVDTVTIDEAGGHAVDPATVPWA